MGPTSAHSLKSTRNAQSFNHFITKPFLTCVYAVTFSKNKKQSFTKNGTKTYWTPTLLPLTTPHPKKVLKIEVRDVH